MPKFTSAYVQINLKDHVDLLSFFQKIKMENACLLQNGMFGRYSIIGFDPINILQYKNSKLSRKMFLDKLEKESKLFHLDLDLPFTGGALGYFSYDFGVALHGIKQVVKNDLKNFPEALFIFPSQIAVFDHEKHTISLIAWAKNSAKAKSKLQLLKKFLSNPRAKKISPNKNPSKLLFKLHDNLSKNQYLDKLDQVKKILQKGNSYQINFSHRFWVKPQKDNFEIYKILTKINPSPYQFYFERKNFAIISNSPERLFQIKASNRLIQSRPIKGTTPRFLKYKEDQHSLKKLLLSLKEKAELDMITDLVRNDLGRICETGSVQVTDERVIESYSHVHHTMANVQGFLKKTASLTDILYAIFPGGSVTGCPKYRTMQIIDQLEEFKRYVYCGSAGYIDGRGNMDFNIMIRTILALKNNQWSLFFHSGGGITIGSDPVKEWEETIHKAQAIIKAIKG